MIALRKKAHCPYCGHRFEIPRPPERDCDPYELECVPYTRDAGRFDPEGEPEWFKPEKWSRIGKDYLTFLNWERFGILRITVPNIQIQYRVQGCPKCSSLFDVYANYTEGITFESLWPHLFARDVEDRQTIKMYYGESWPVWLARKMGKGLRSIFMGGLAFGFLIFLIWFIPRGLLVGFRTNTLELILYGVAALSIASLMIVMERYVHYFESTKDFNDLFSIKNRKFGLRHWRNYVLSRFVGVQRLKLPSLSQVDIISGGISVVLMIATWVAHKISSAVGLIWLLFSLLMLFLALSIGNRVKQNFKKRATRLLITILLVVATVGLIVTAAFILGINSIIGLSAAEISFWMVFAYFVGISGLLSLNTSFYILDGLTRIPMNLTPYNKFQQVKPLRVLETFSTALLLILLVSSLAITYISASLQLEWLINWFRVIMVFLFIASGFALKRGEYFGIALLYFVVTFLPKFDQVNLAIPLDPRLIVLGLLFTLIVGIQIAKMDGTIARLLKNAKDNELSRIDARVRTIAEQIAEMDRQLSHSAAFDETRENLQRQRQSALESIEVLLRLRDRIEGVSLQSFQWRRISELFAPLISSVIVPILVNYASDFLKKALGIV